MPSLAHEKRRSSVCLEAQTTAEPFFLKHSNFKELFNAHLFVPHCNWHCMRNLTVLLCSSIIRSVPRYDTSNLH